LIKRIAYQIDVQSKHIPAKQIKKRSHTIIAESALRLTPASQANKRETKEPKSPQILYGNKFEPKSLANRIAS
jgi:hypothetical protein